MTTNSVWAHRQQALKVKRAKKAKKVRSTGIRGIADATITPPQDFLFIAAPFFNPAQIEHCESIITVVEKAKVPYYCAYKHANKGHPIRDPKVARELWGMNLEHIQQCTRMLVCFDWLLPPGQWVGQWNERTLGWDTTHLNIPDNGVCVEVGYATAIGKPMVGYRLPSTQPLNLMLAMTCQGFITSSRVLQQWVKTGKSELLQDWSGVTF